MCFIAFDGTRVSRTELDLYTDSVERVLNNERGRRLFSCFIQKCGFQNGIRILEFWELTESLFVYKESAGGGSPRRYNKEIKKLLKKAENIDEFDENIMVRLHALAENPESSKNQVNIVLQMLKAECARALAHVYKAFQEHFVPAN